MSRAILLTLLLAAAPLGAQQATPEAVAAAVRAEVDAAELRRHAEAIVRHQRPSGSAGENAAIDYIVETLRAEGVPVEVHTFQAYTSDPVSARIEVPGTDFTPRAITLSFSTSTRGLEAELVDLGSLRDLPELEVGTGERVALPAAVAAAPHLAAVRGRIALVSGQPRNGPTAVLQRLGALAVIYVNPEERLNDLIVTSTWGNPSLRNAHRLELLPVAQIAAGDGARLRELMAVGRQRARISTEVRTGWMPLRLAVATIPAPAGAAAPFALLGGHIDAWYHGATDEGASNAAMVSLASGFHRQRDRLRRGLVIAWWPGHSNGRYAGSTWFADQYFDRLRERGVAYLNIDGVGQTGAVRLGANTTASLAPLAEAVVRGREDVAIRPTRPGRNSDQSFNGIGLPLLQLNRTRRAEDGGYWWWHTPDDTFDKIDFEVLERDAELYADALAEILVAPQLPIDPVAEVEELGELLAARQESAGDRFDLRPVLARQRRLLEAVRAVTPAWREGMGMELDLAMLRVLRPLHRVVHSPSDPFHPDPGLTTELLPGLDPLSILAAEPPHTDRYRFAETSLLRERNRLTEALDEALREVELLRARIEGRRP